MRRLLLLICGVSALAIGGEFWSRAGQDTQSTVPVNSDPARATLPPTKATPSAAGGSVGVWVDTALARPLFAADRRPIPGFAATNAGMPRLSGVIASPVDTVAIFQVAGAAKPVAARGGDRIGDWLVTAISSDFVTLKKGDSSKMLRLAFENLTPTAQPEHNNAAPSRWVTAAASGILRNRWSNPHLQP
ncbi:MAG TPA: hypothetical protein VHB27_22350 [Rhodopila sp.]|uniref:hypothetical protein n=1 Tax=Rhodopila sp. TaxID=2480087 RepID=UPI002CF4C638|nr:hypothetical protein [Rhodopila sp.]HVY17977.1 hypothetical protein [Rhodopila sp.]